MSDLISRESAICTLMSLIVPLEEYQDFNQGVNNSCVAIMELPSAEPEIIYCKVCDWYLGNARCVHNDDLWGEDDYCSHAERKK